MKNLIFICAVLGMAQPVLRAQLPVITNQPVSRALWAGGNVTFAVGISNAGAYTYQWQFNSTNLPDGIITTVAGNGSNIFSGESGLAINAGMAPRDILADTAGQLFLTDWYNNRVLRVDTNGIVTSIAGNGMAAFSGDGGPATNASFNGLECIAMDANGNLFLTDLENFRIRKVNSNGIISTVAGVGTDTYSGDGAMATNAGLMGPWSIAVDDHGNFYTGCIDDRRIRKVDTNGVITTFAGVGNTEHGAFTGDGGSATNANLNRPISMTFNSSGELFFADDINDRVRKVDTNGIITTVAGFGPPDFANPPIGDGGPATNGYLIFPSGVAFDADGSWFIADGAGNNRVAEVNTNGIISTVAGVAHSHYQYSGDGGFATNAGFYFPGQVTCDRAGNLYIVDEGNYRIRKVTKTVGPTLALNSVNVANSGSYQLMVTGPGGSVTSSVVNLVVATSPLISQTTRNPDGSIALNFVSLPGSTNLVLCATNLLPSSPWQVLSTNLAGPDGNWHFTDTSTRSGGARFYRSLQQ